MLPDSEENFRGDVTYYCPRSNKLNFVVFRGIGSKKDNATCLFLTSSTFKLSSAIQFHFCTALDSLSFSFSFWCGFNSLMPFTGNHFLLRFPSVTHNKHSYQDLPSHPRHFLFFLACLMSQCNSFLLQCNQVYVLSGSGSY